VSAGENTSDKKDLAQIVVDVGFITTEQLETALQLQRTSGKPLDRVLTAQGLISPEDLAMAQSLRLNVPLVDLDRHKIPPEVLELIPDDTAKRYSVLPLTLVGGILVVVTADPENVQAMNEISRLTGMPIEVTMACPEHIRKAIALYYGAMQQRNRTAIGGEVSEHLQRIAPPVRVELSLDMRSVSDSVANAPAVRALELIIEQAVKNRASDVHIEPQRDQLRIRYRIDGVLHDVSLLSLGVAQWLLARIKVLADMDIAEHRRPQDGQFTFKMGGKEVDIRVATFNTIYGETAVLRILDKSLGLLGLSELGLSPGAMDRYERMLRSPFGMIAVSGPTGAGKTTTLYASVNQLNNVERNIVTIEDPVEYAHNGIKPSEINPAADITFASGLRSILRIDPDVILIGEIRDEETAQIAVQAALTGHLVLSSIHANDAVGALFRFAYLGVERFLLSSALTGIVAQRMVRRVCHYCSTLREPEPEEKAAYEEELQEAPAGFHYGTGCDLCSQTGYLGRTCVFEVMLVTEEIRKQILRGASRDEIYAQAIKEGMTTMRHDGMLKVEQGITTPYEVLRAAYYIS